MRFGNLSKVAMAFLGVCFTLVGALNLVIAAIGNFSMGRTAVTAMGFAFLVIATPFFAFLYSRNLAKLLGAVVLLVFAAAMIWLSFLPDTPAPDPTIYQVAAIPLGVLLIARIGLALRGKRSRAGA